MKRSCGVASRSKISPAVDWPDDIVERAVRHLTELDTDHATEVNRRGWSSSASSSGHWCNAMLDEDRDLAIKTARTMLGGYRRQLEEAGIISKEAA